MKSSERDEQSQNWSDIIRISEVGKSYIHKIVSGPKRVYSVFYPSVDQEGKTRKFVLTVKDYAGNPFNALAKIDKDIQRRKINDRLSGADREEALKKVRSSLDPTGSYHALILDKYDDIPVIKHADYKKTIFDAVLLAESEKYVDDKGNKDESRLRYGLLWMIWFEFQRIENKKSSNKLYNFEYVTKVLEKFIGKWRIPSNFLNKPVDFDAAGNRVIVKTGTKDVSIPVIEAGMFTEQEFKAICNFEHELSDIVKPMTPEELEEKAGLYPLKLNATDDSGQFLLPDWTEIKEEIGKQGLMLPIDVADTPRLMSPKEEPKETKKEVEQPKKEVKAPKKEKESKKKETVDEVFDFTDQDDSPVDNLDDFLGTNDKEKDDFDFGTDLV